mmetsp:Transcript_33112/g.75687  ORF Transcript_33112/g.75687 Transcript_33112/m.75687 type:complete len:271 (+) Transcript_33112:485-1297(+)
MPPKEWTSGRSPTTNSCAASWGARFLLLRPRKPLVLWCGSMRRASQRSLRAARRQAAKSSRTSFSVWMARTSPASGPSSHRRRSIGLWLRPPRALPRATSEATARARRARRRMTFLFGCQYSVSSRVPSTPQSNRLPRRLSGPRGTISSSLGDGNTASLKGAPAAAAASSTPSSISGSRRVSRDSRRTDKHQLAVATAFAASGTTQPTRTSPVSCRHPLWGRPSSTSSSSRQGEGAGEGGALEGREGRSRSGCCAQSVRRTPRCPDLRCS